MKSKVIYLLVIILLLSSLFALNPLHIFPVEQKPEPSPLMKYDYYIIVDESSGSNLMYVPLVVNIGDEVLSEENKRYKVVKIEQNRAFARFIEDVNLEKYKKK